MVVSSSELNSCTTTNVHPLTNYQLPTKPLLRLLMRCVLPAEAAVLAHLEPLRRLPLVLRRAVVAAFALATRHMDDVSHRLRFQFGLSVVAGTLGGSSDSRW